MTKPSVVPVAESESVASDLSPLIAQQLEALDYPMPDYRPLSNGEIGGLGIEALEGYVYGERLRFDSGGKKWEFFRSVEDDRFRLTIRVSVGPVVLCEASMTLDRIAGKEGEEQLLALVERLAVESVAVAKKAKAYQEKMMSEADKQREFEREHLRQEEEAGLRDRDREGRRPGETSLAPATAAVGANEPLNPGDQPGRLPGDRPEQQPGRPGYPGAVEDNPPQRVAPDEHRRQHAGQTGDDQTEPHPSHPIVEPDDEDEDEGKPPGAGKPPGSPGNPGGPHGQPPGQADKPQPKGALPEGEAEDNDPRRKPDSSRHVTQEPERRTQNEPPKRR